MRHPHLASIVFVLLASACAVEEELGGNGDLAGQEAYESDGKSDAAFDALTAELTAKYGLRPRRYNGLFDGSNEAERRFLTALPSVVAFLDQRASELGHSFRFHPAEIATNFISEGAFFLLTEDIVETDWAAALDGDIDPDARNPDAIIDGFRYLGVDTFCNNIEELVPWMTEELKDAFIARPARCFSVSNEKGELVTSIVVDNIEQGLMANAAMFAWSRALATRDLAAQGKRYADLGFEPAFFWSTVYFNAGPGFGAKALREEGVDYWKKKWTAGDDHAKYSRYARYNALWRTSSYEFMRRVFAW